VINKDQLREEVQHFFKKYRDLDDEALSALLSALILLSYPTKEGQDS
jgi:hypothetical protein